jgi:hypothetical protein
LDLADRAISNPAQFNAPSSMQANASAETGSMKPSRIAFSKPETSKPEPAEIDRLSISAAVNTLGAS